MWGGVCVRVWSTTNGVAVRDQVLSPGRGSNTCQVEHGGCTMDVSIMAGNSQVV